MTSDEHAAQAQSLRARLLELKGQAEKAHKVEKEPHLKAGRDVDAKWLPLAKDADTAAKSIRNALDAYETEKLREQRALQVSIEAKAKAAGMPAPLPAPPPPAPNIKGAYGKGASVSLIKVVTVIDFDAVYVNFRQNPDLQKLLTKLAQNAVDAGYPVPGVTVEEQRRVK